MKKVAVLFSVLAGMCGQQAFAADVAQGNLLELHSCELYAGGCVVSSEATLGGRYMVQVWQFTGGSFEHTPLHGLAVAVLQTGPENLASSGAVPSRAVAYVPETASPQQRQALLAWVKATQPGLKHTPIQTRVAPLQFARESQGYSFSAGKYITVRTAPLEACETGACGEALWYTPRSPAGFFAVAVNRASSVQEPLLKLNWQDAGQRSVFLAKFGAGPEGRGLYVSTAELCGSAGKLF